MRQWKKRQLEGNQLEITITHWKYICIEWEKAKIYIEREKKAPMTRSDWNIGINYCSMACDFGQGSETERKVNVLVWRHFAVTV